MNRFRPAAVTAVALAALLVLAGCSPAAPADPAPTPPASEPAPTTEPPAATGPSPTPTEPEPGTPEDWTAFALGDGRTSWSLPPGWTADIESEALEGDASRTDYRGLIRDAEGTTMLQFAAVAEGQYVSDGLPCERPETEAFEVTPMGDAVAVADAALVAVAFEQAERVVLAAGISQNDAREACEPGILALYDAGYDYLVFEIVDNAGDAPPTFATFDDARAYLESDQYGQIHDVLASFELAAQS